MKTLRMTICNDNAIIINIDDLDMEEKNIITELIERNCISYENLVERIVIFITSPLSGKRTTLTDMLHFIDMLSSEFDVVF